MAPWDFITKAATDPVLPATLQGSHAGTDTAFEVFVDGALTKIYNEASGRSKEQRQLREACKKVLGTAPGRQLGGPSVTSYNSNAPRSFQTGRLPSNVALRAL